MRLILDRWLPVPKTKAEPQPLAKPISGEPVEAIQQISEAVSSGDLDIESASKLGALVGLQIRAKEHAEMDQRLGRIEELLSGNK